jgi:hypothetical protein
MIDYIEIYNCTHISIIHTCIIDISFLLPQDCLNNGFPFHQGGVKLRPTQVADRKQGHFVPELGKPSGAWGAILPMG